LSSLGAVKRFEETAVGDETTADATGWRRAVARVIPVWVLDYPQRNAPAGE
jgi:hypothetical protein